MLILISTQAVASGISSSSAYPISISVAVRSSCPSLSDRARNTPLGSFFLVQGYLSALLTLSASSTWGKATICISCICQVDRFCDSLCCSLFLESLAIIPSIIPASKIPLSLLSRLSMNFRLFSLWFQNNMLPCKAKSEADQFLCWCYWLCREVP